MIPNIDRFFFTKPRDIDGYEITTEYCECGCKKTYYRYQKIELVGKCKMEHDFYNMTSGIVLDGHIIRKLREQKGKTMNDVTMDCDLSSGTITRIESLHHSGSIETAYKLSKYFGVTIESMITLKKQLK